MAWSGHDKKSVHSVSWNRIGPCFYPQYASSPLRASTFHVIVKRSYAKSQLRTLLCCINRAVKHFVGWCSSLAALHSSPCVDRLHSSQAESGGPARKLAVSWAICSKQRFGMATYNVNKLQKRAPKASPRLQLLICSQMGQATLNANDQAKAGKCPAWTHSSSRLQTQHTQINSKRRPGFPRPQRPAIDSSAHETQMTLPGSWPGGPCGDKHPAEFGSSSWASAFKHRESPSLAIH